MIKITKFKGIRLNTNNIKTHQAYVEVEKDGVTRSIGLPVRAGSSSSAASAGRKWRNIGDNMARLEGLQGAKEADHLLLRLRIALLRAYQAGQKDMLEIWERVHGQ